MAILQMLVVQSSIILIPPLWWTKAKSSLLNRKSKIAILRIKHLKSETSETKAKITPEQAIIKREKKAILWWYMLKLRGKVSPPQIDIPKMTNLASSNNAESCRRMHIS